MRSDSITGVIGKHQFTENGIRYWLVTVVYADHAWSLPFRGHFDSDPQLIKIINVSDTLIQEYLKIEVR